MIDKRYAITILTIHLLACAAFVPWLFSWSGVALLIGGIYFYGGLGINLCFHRLLTHRSFACPLWLEHSLAVIGVACLQDGPLAWCSTHRIHHEGSDKDGDPHSPRHGIFHSHFGWLLYENRDIRCAPAYLRYCGRDLLGDRFYRRLQSAGNIVAIYLGHAALYVAAGFYFGGWQLAASWLTWGVFLRTVAVMHISFSVNSIGHLFGYRNFETRDDSRNNPLVAFLTSGEGWHNSHHAHPSSASNWTRWWEVDGIYMVICALEFCGLAWDVKRPALQPITNEVTTCQKA
jgi:stearoyl-CoA desaturase (delta-9 desaturase)